MLPESLALWVGCGLLIGAAIGLIGALLVFVRTFENEVALLGGPPQ